MRDVCGFPLYADSADRALAQRELEALELGDGLPLVIPTLGRVEDMLAEVSAPQYVHGLLPPLLGELRADAVAYQCVLAGCKPAELAVVFTAAQACLDPDFNLLGILTTTGSAAVAMVVHGAIATALEVNASSNCLGPGARANACIGRALALVLRNVAGAKQGVADMATMGQPGKLTFCFAESTEPGLAGFAQRQGYECGRSAVTVLGVSGTAEVLPLGSGASPEQILAPLALAMGASVMMSGARRREPGQQVVLLPPELVKILHRHDFDLARMQTWLFEHARVPDLPGFESRPQEPARRAAASPADILPIQTGGPGVKMTYLPLWAGGSRLCTRAINELRG